MKTKSFVDYQDRHIHIYEITFLSSQLLYVVLILRWLFCC